MSYFPTTADLCSIADRDENHQDPVFCRIADMALSIDRNQPYSGNDAQATDEAGLEDFSPLQMRCWADYIGAQES